MWGRLYAGATQGALAKLDNVLPDEQRHEVAWARRSLVATGMQRSALAELAPVIEKLRRAIRERRQVQMTYSFLPACLQFDGRRGGNTGQITEEPTIYLGVDDRLFFFP